MALKLFRLSGLLLIVFVHQGFCAVEKNLVCNDLDCSPQMACACVSDDVTIPWNIPNYGSDIFGVSWTLENATSSLKTISSQSGSASPSIVNSFNVIHNGQGSITLKSVTTAENTGIYRCDVSYNLGAGSPVTGTVTISVYDAPADLAFTTISETEYQCSAGKDGSPATSLDIWVNDVNQNSDKATVKKSDFVECCRSGAAVRCMSDVSTGCTSAKKCIVVQNGHPDRRCWCLCKDEGWKCFICWLILFVVFEFIIGSVIGCCIIYQPGPLEECLNCEASDCSECCQCCDNNTIRCKCCCSCWNIGKVPFWYYILWWTVICAPVAFGIFIVMKLKQLAKTKKKSPEEQPMTDIKTDD